MFTENKDTFSEVVDITLYRYNSVDNRIWAILKNSEVHKVLSDQSILDIYDIYYGDRKDL